MAIDLILTSAHHLAVFTLVGVFAAEFAAHFVECDRRLRLRQI